MQSRSCSVLKLFGWTLLKSQKSLFPSSKIFQIQSKVINKDIWFYPFKNTPYIKEKPLEKETNKWVIIYYICKEVERGGGFRKEGGGYFSFSIFCHMSVSICLCVREGRCPKIMIKMKSRKNTKKQSEWF